MNDEVFLLKNDKIIKEMRKKSGRKYLKVKNYDDRYIKWVEKPVRWELGSKSMSSDGEV